MPSTPVELLILKPVEPEWTILQKRLAIMRLTWSFVPSHIWKEERGYISKAQQDSSCSL